MCVPLYLLLDSGLSTSLTDIGSLPTFVRICGNKQAFVGDRSAMQSRCALSKPQGHMKPLWLWQRAVKWMCEHDVWTDQPREHEVLPKLPPLLGVSQLFVDAKIYLCIPVALWAR